MDKPLKAEQQKHSSLTNQWDRVESDTESLAQERACRQQLQTKHTLAQKGNAEYSLHSEGEDEDASDDETDLQVCDSIELAATHQRWLQTESNPALLQTESLATLQEGTRQLLSDDVYSDLRYDPDWRTNLKGAAHFEEYYHVPEEKCSQAYGGRQGLMLKGGYRYIVDTSPAVMVTPPMAGMESVQPYHLHLQDAQTSLGKSSHCHNDAVQLRSSEGDLSQPSSISRKNDSISQKELEGNCEHNCSNAGENSCCFPELTEDQECKTYYRQDQRHIRSEPTQTQNVSTSACSSPKVLLNKRPERLTQDIVERNKKTLGLNKVKCGSYVTVHGPKPEMPHNVNKMQETLEEMTSTESQEYSSDPELRWIQKTQQLRVTQINRGKKAQRNGNPKAPQQPPASGVRAEQGDCLISLLTRPVAATQPKSQKITSSQSLPPNIHLNINLNTSSHFLPLLQQKVQDAIISVASLPGCPLWSPASEAVLTLSPEYQQMDPAKFSQIFQKGLNGQNLQHLESSSEERQRTPALKWPLSYEGGDQKWSQSYFHSNQFSQNLPSTPTTPVSLASGPYTVLPPIGKPVAGREAEPSPGPSADTARAIHRSTSDGYVLQMEKQKQQRARVSYKAYSHKDCKQLISDINLQGLGPDYRILEKTAEKIKRQRLYSNVIREQNKKISRNPFLLAKDPEGSDKKVPRIKALEYAKTIAKPPVPSQAKQKEKQQSQGFTEHAPYVDGLDVSQPPTLEVLRKRHEEEKQAVALFRKVHAV